MANTISPNMNLIVPGVGTEAGPTYAFDVNSSLTLIDQHDHSLGNGVQVTPAGLNINADLSFTNNSATDLKSTVFQAQASIDTLQTLYVSQGTETPITNDLWFNDGNGNKVQITSGGLVNATIASIPGESYSAGTFFWKQGALSTTPANFDIGSITLRPNTAGTVNGIQLSPPVGISSQYNLILPALPAAQNFMLLDNSGNITATIPVASGINTANLANASVTKAKLAGDIYSWNTATFTTAGSFVVPAGVNLVYVLGAGGGGGGGGGAGSNTTGPVGGGGGGGGGGAIPYLVPFEVTPAASIGVTIGLGGGGGPGGAALTNGTAGSQGGSSTFGTLLFPGATGGQGGVFGGAGGAGGSGTRWAGNIGGAGGASGGTFSGVTGDRTVVASGGAAGTGTNGGGGGGGGAAGFSSGANAGAGGSPSGGGNPAAANSSAGGGGGGGHGVATSSSGSAGGNGGSGKIVVYWLGTP